MSLAGPDSAALFKRSTWCRRRLSSLERSPLWQVLQRRVLHHSTDRYVSISADCIFFVLTCFVVRWYRLDWRDDMPRRMVVHRFERVLLPVPPRSLDADKHRRHYERR